NEMKRWGIKDTNLPPDSIIVNKIPGVWDLYKWQISGAVFFLLSEALMIIFLALQLILKKKARGELKKLNERLANILDGTNAGTWEWNVQTGEIAYNERWAQIIGYTLEELSPLSIDTWNRFSHPEDRKKAEVLLDQVFNRKLDYYSVEARMKHKNGSWVWVADRGKVISWTAEGKPLLISGTHTDISTRKRSEEELRKSREEYRLLIENSHDIIFTLSMGGIITFASPSWTSLLGHPITQVIGSSYQQFVHPDDIAETESFLQKILGTTEKSSGVEYRVKHIDGSWRWHFSNGIPIKDADEKNVGFEGIAQDITDRKRAQDALRKSEEQYRLINDSSQDSIYSFDTDNHFTSANKHLCESLGLSSEQIIGKTPSELGFEESRCLDLAAMHKTVRDTDQTLIFEGDTMMPDGQMHVFELTINPLHDNEGRNVGIAETSRDITESKKAEAQINYLSYHNQLTGLYNRHFIEKEIVKLDTEKNLPISLVMCDLNGLKLINDIFGHAEGDGLLVNTSEILKRICRTDDILARWGGDEFVLLLPRTSAADSDKIVELIKKECKKTVNQKIPVSLSIGAATKTEAGQDIQLTLVEAESNMYKNKLGEKESFSSSIIYALEQALYEKSNETKDHTDRMHDLALKLGKSIGLPSSLLDELTLLVSLHDIGKVAIPEKILSKKTRLSEKEWKVIKNHPEIGFNIARSSPQIAHIANSILACHEHWDGGGYPLGIRGELIPVTARIILIVDAFDVMISGRSYKKPMSMEDAIDELRRCSGTQFDPSLVKNFIEILSDQKAI
ncbi:MAG: PAS domain S-box protein, partial [Actinomycetota bacterium]